MANLIPDNITKMNRNEFLTFLDTTPDSTATFVALGIGVSDYGIDMSPSVDYEKWILETTARPVHTSNEKSGSVTQTVYKGDPLFEFIKEGRDKLNYKTHILDVDVFDGTESSGTITAPAKLSDGMIAIETFMGEDATIDYTIHYAGDAEDGIATIASDGTVTFAPNTSL